jgi:hypothetical protein
MRRPIDKNRPTDDQHAGTSDVSIRERLRNILLTRIRSSERRKQWNLISSEELVGKYVRERWGVSTSQETCVPRLFQHIRNQSRRVLQQVLDTGQLHLEIDSRAQVYLVFKFEDTRENLVLGFFRPDSRKTAGM